MFKNVKKYITRGVNAEVDFRLQMIMFEMIDRLETSKTKVDYLQVFEIKRINENDFKLIHRQEVPKFESELILHNIDIENDMKIFVIAEANYCTMMLAEEY